MKSVLNEIKPSKKEEEQLFFITDEIISKIKIPHTKVQLGGSAAKGTWLKGDYDLDIYVKFSKKYKNKNISDILEKKLKKNFSEIARVHGSRDYFQLPYKNYLIEIIPIFNINKADNAENITDVSPLHVKWVCKYSEKADEIRLAKAFCKANGIYGAESYIMGFSGYVLEILTIYFGSFKNLMHNVSKWGLKTIIDVQGYYSDTKEIFENLNPSKQQSPLILIDPVQKIRNAAAGINNEKYLLFVSKAKEYLKNPSPDFFKPKKFSLNRLKKQASKDRLIVLNVSPLKGKKDIVGSKLLKCYNIFLKHLTLHDFIVKSSDWVWEKEDQAIFWYILDPMVLSKKIKHYGPPKENKKRFENFKNKWKNKKIKFVDGNAYVIIERKYCKPKKLIKDLIAKKFISLRVKKISVKEF